MKQELQRRLEGIRVTRDKAHKKGFVLSDKMTGTTGYYVNHEKGQAILFCDSDNYGEIIIATTEELCERIDYATINLKKNINNPMPCISGNKGYLHKLMRNDIQKGMQVDHRNNNRCYCMPKNLRSCPNKKNSYNRISTVRKLYFCNAGYYYKMSVKPDDMGVIQTLQRQGFRNPAIRETRKHDSHIQMKSPFFDTMEKAYQNMRLINEELYGEFAYKMENDFCHEWGIHLLISCYFFGEISEPKMYQLNREYWESVLPEKSAYMKEE